jgi:hypothetical protein
MRDGVYAGYGACASGGAPRSGIIREDMGFWERFGGYRPLGAPASPNTPGQMRTCPNWWGDSGLGGDLDPWGTPEGRVLETKARL